MGVRLAPVAIAAILLGGCTSGPAGEAQADTDNGEQEASGSGRGADAPSDAPSADREVAEAPSTSTDAPGDVPVVEGGPEEAASDASADTSAPDDARVDARPAEAAADSPEPDSAGDTPSSGDASSGHASSVDGSSVDGPIDPEPVGASCRAAADCSSGNCVGGVCCGSPCQGAPHAVLTCATGSCAIAACTIGWADCNGAEGDGCEQDIASDLHNCGGCGIACDDGDACTHDVCRVVGGLASCANVNVNACPQGCNSSVACGFSDRDDDGLNDAWEANRYVDNDCNGAYTPGIDTPLPQANPNEPDVYVKWDYMVASGHSHQPSDAAMAMVQTAFANHSTHLHYYPTSDAIPESLVLTLSADGSLPQSCTGADVTSVPTLKTSHFPAYLTPAYHYGVFAHYVTCDSALDCQTCPATAKSVAAPNYGLSGLAELPGNDFIVSMGALVDLGVTIIPDLVNAGTFMHELGHNINLHHGGTDNLVQKPNYVSVLNYTYQFGIGQTAAPGPFPTSTSDPSVSYYIDYSRYTGGTLLEGMASGSNTCISDGSGGMSEPAGITGTAADDTDITVFYTDFGGTPVFAPSNGTPVDWDTTLPATDLHVYGDVSGDGACSVLTGFNDWAQTSPSPGVVRDTHLSLGFQCNTGSWADGATPPSSIEDREMTAYGALVNQRIRLPSHLPFARTCPEPGATVRGDLSHSPEYRVRPPAGDHPGRRPRRPGRDLPGQGFDREGPLVDAGRAARGDRSREQGRSRALEPHSTTAVICS